MDVKTAFLNEELDEEIYMEQPVVSLSKVKSAKFASFKDLYMALNNHQDNGTSDFIR